MCAWTHLIINNVFHMKVIWVFICFVFLIRDLEQIFRIMCLCVCGYYICLIDAQFS